MANLLDIMRTGGNALSGQQVAAQIIGENISGTSVAGYHRQDPNFVSMPGLGGIADVTATRQASRFLDVQVNTQQSAYSFNNERAQQLAVVMSSVGTLEAGGLSEGVSNFFGSWRNVNVAPADITTRRDLLAQSDLLCTRFNQASQNLTAAQLLADQDIVLTLSPVNDALDLVAQLNAAVGSANASGAPSGILSDQRDSAVNDLAGLIGATSSLDDQGMYTVSLAGISVVSATASYHLTAAPDSGSTYGLHKILVAGTTQGDVASLITGGVLGAKLAARDGDIPSTLTSLDQFAFDFATAVNTVHEAGYGLDGVTARKLFDVPATAPFSSAAISVDSLIADQPAFLAAATDPLSLFGDSSNALAMIDLESTNCCTGSTETPNAATARIVSQSGESVALASAKRDTAEATMLQIKGLSEQQIGVSLSEQLLQLSRVQNAFQAASRLVAVTERMLESLQQLV